jgi:hypothetical protein
VSNALYTLVKRMQASRDLSPVPGWLVLSNEDVAAAEQAKRICDAVPTLVEALEEIAAKTGDSDTARYASEALAAWKEATK